MIKIKNNLFYFLWKTYVQSISTYNFYFYILTGSDIFYGKKIPIHEKNFGFSFVIKISYD